MASPFAPAVMPGEPHRHVQCRIPWLISFIVWQDPFVEVIKFGMTHRNVGWHAQGDVEQTQDQHIHKNVFRIRGAIAATNYLRVPRLVGEAVMFVGSLFLMAVVWSLEMQQREHTDWALQGATLTCNYVASETYP